ncbi:MAG: membrane protein insertase YidC, partial [Planctomycetota bacterium]
REPGGDQRFLTFMLLSVSILMFSQFFVGPQAPPKPVANAVADDDDGAAADNGDENEPAGDKPAADGDAPAGDTPPAEIEEQPDAAPQLVALGSVDAEGPHRMLLTLDNRGAAVTRAEMASRKFRDLDDRSGYLGELGLIKAAGGGAEVTIVGPGTPAAEAGIQVGDVIVSVMASKGGGKVDGPESIRSRLAKLKPGTGAMVSVRRGGEEMPFKATLTRRPLSVLRPESENIRLHNPELAKDFIDVPSFVVKIDEVGNRNAENEEVAAANKRLSGDPWEIVQADSNSATFRLRLAKLGLEFEKKFTLKPAPDDEREDDNFPGYDFAMEVRVKNLLPEPQSIAYQLAGPNGLPIEGWWYTNRIGRKENGNGAWTSIGIRDVIAKYNNTSYVIQNRCSKIVDGDVDPMGQGQPLAYVGVDAQYFSVVLIPEKEDPSEAWFDVTEAVLATPKLREKGTLPTYNNTTFIATRKSVDLEPAGAAGDTLEDRFRVFAGPKRPELLAQYVPGGNPSNGLNYSLYYGWFGPVAYAMLQLLHTFYGWVNNYGIAIIMLTICVRGAMFPLSRKQAINMAKMQELKPEMDRITEKYKDDMEKRTRAQQELYRKHNFNPMGGCLPMFVQLPIFIGLYRALAVDLELRQAPLFGESVRFCGNLGAPDAFYDWSWLMPQWFNNGQGMFALGPYFNLLPIITIVLFLLQQKMFMPPPANEQAELQQKMMKYMMVFFGIMFFKVPSGLCLYFIASSLWGIAERKLLPKPQPPADEGFSKPATETKPKPTGGNRPNANGDGAASKRKKQRQAANKKKNKRR